MNKNLFILIFFILFMLLISNISEINRLKNSLQDANNTIDNYDEALNEANNNIEICNSSIEEAQYSKWSTYEEMGEALDNLETVDTVSAP